MFHCYIGMVNELEQRLNRAESAEVAVESKEKQVEEAEKKLAAKERLEMTSREIKTTKNQIQNIVANMQQVVKAVAAIRAQLQLSQGGSIPSVQQDEKILQVLRSKLDALYGEIGDLKNALLAEEKKNVQEESPELAAEDVVREADRRVHEILEKLGVSKRDL